MAPTRVGWQSGPQTRGTPELLLSCFTTLSLCAWSAYHPNVPTGRSKRARLGHRLAWMCIAIVVPEAVLWCAWEQWWAARRLVVRVHDLREGNPYPEESDGGCQCCKRDGERDAVRDDVVEQEESGMQDERERDEIEVLAEDHEDDGLLAVSIQKSSDEIEAPAEDGQDRGPVSTHESSNKTQARTDNYEDGGSVSVKGSSVGAASISEDSKMAPWTLSQAFFALSGGYALPSTNPKHPPTPLTTTGILLLLRLNLLPQVSPSAISDKSKADGIAKVLVCTQAGWFLLQVVARAAAKLPITTLEIHVLAHVVCAFAIYFVWFQKGYDVGEPVVVDSEEGKDLAALFALNGHASPDNVVQRCSFGSQYTDPASVTPSEPHKPRHASAIYWRKLLDMFGIEKEPREVEGMQVTSEMLDSEVTQHIAQMERANRALAFLKAANVHVSYYEETRFTENGEQKYISVNHRYTVSVRSNLTIEGLDVDEREKKDGFRDRQIKVYGLITFLYGALHLPALSSSHFPSRLEYYFWLGSTASMLSAPVSTLLIMYSLELSGPLKRLSTSIGIAQCLIVAGSKFLGMCWVLCFTAVLIVASGYPVARAYVLVESLVGLRNVDSRVYDTVPWTKWMPHA